MKKIGKIVIGCVIFVWLIVAIFVTVCLLSYNEFKVTTFGKTTLLIIDSDELEPEFLEGDLLIIKRNSDNKLNIGDRVFYYNSAMNSSTLVYHDTIEGKEDVDKDETTYLLGGSNVSGKYVIGKLEGSKVYHKAGLILNIFSSKWGYMFLVVFPTLFAIVYEIIMVVETARSAKKNELNE